MKVRLAVACILAILGSATSEADAPAPEGLAAVTRVVELLRELKARVQRDGEGEQETYDKFACWCEKVTGKKAASITQIRAAIQSTGNKILELRGSAATKIAEIKGLSEDIRKNEETQQRATAIRQRENAAFVAEKGELQQAIAALEGAVAVLKGATPAASLLRRDAAVSRRALPVALAAVRTAVGRLPLSRTRRGASRQLAALRTGATHRYSPQSATVQGILADMYDTFTTDLEARTRDEAIAHRNYEALMGTWQSELATLQETVVKKEREKTEVETMLADGIQSYADSEAQLKADITFFDATKSSCVSKAKEWGERKALRAEELAGISQALTILTADSARDLFSKAIKPGLETSFLQVGAAAAGASRGSAAEAARRALVERARETRSLRLAELASMLSDRGGGHLGGAGHFDKVLEAIDGLLATLQGEERDDDRKASECKDQYQNIALITQDLQWKLANNKARIQKLEKARAAREAEKGEVVEQLAGMEVEMGRMKAQRTEENGKFLQAKTDDQQAIALLQSAVDALKQYYEKHGVELGPMQGLLQAGAVGAQHGRNATDVPDTAPEAKFSEKGLRKGESKGVLSILTMIIEDLKREISAGMDTEVAAQLDFEQSLGAAEALAKQLNATRINLEGMIASRAAEVTEEQGVMAGNQGEMTNQNKTKQDITPSCDWIIGNLEDRRRKRTLEADALRSAKEYLAGAQPSVAGTAAASSSFLQWRGPRRRA